MDWQGRKQAEENEKSHTVMHIARGKRLSSSVEQAERRRVTKALQVSPS